MLVLHTCTHTHTVPPHGIASPPPHLTSGKDCWGHLSSELGVCRPCTFVKVRGALLQATWLAYCGQNPGPRLAAAKAAEVLISQEQALDFGSGL